MQNPDGSLNAGYLKGTYTTRETYKDGKQYNIRHASATLDFSAFDGSPAKIQDLVGSGFHTTCFTCSKNYSIEFVDDGQGSRMEESGKHFIFKIDISNATSASDLTDAIVAGTQNGNPNHHFTNFEASGGKLIVYDNRCIDNPPAGASDPDGWRGWDFPDFNVNFNTNPKGGRFGDGIVHAAPAPSPPNGGTNNNQPEGDIFFQIGPSAKEILGVILPDIDTWEMGLSEVKVTTQKRAAIAADTLRLTIDYISQERGRMGAYESRLEHTYKAQTITKENLTAAESRIRDTDMAEEMTQFTKNNILLQTAQSMLAQANTAPQNIMRLLQG